MRPDRVLEIRSSDFGLEIAENGQDEPSLDDI